MIPFLHQETIIINTPQKKHSIFEFTITLIRAYTEPNKYAVDLPIDNIVCYGDIDYSFIQKLVELGSSKFKPIVVIKHPTEEIYAVGDGHHRFKAAQISGAKTIKSVILYDSVGIVFEATKQGIFQPSKKFMKYIRNPLKKFASGIINKLKQEGDHS